MDIPPHIAMLLFSILFIWLFRKPIAERIRHIKSVSRDGILMDQTRKLEAVSNIYEDLLGKKDSIVMEEQKNSIKRDLINRHLITDKDDNKAIEVLIHQLANTQLKLNFEKIYNLIFGSQINLLKILNGTPRHKNNVNSYCQNIIDTHDELSNFTTKIYLDFLIENTLIIYNQEEETYSITYYGYEFLNWLLQSGKNENKLY